MHLGMSSIVQNTHKHTRDREVYKHDAALVAHRRLDPVRHEP